MTRKIFLFCFFIILMGFVSATFGEVKPAYYKVNFVPGLKENFEFDFVFDSGSEIETYVSGDLAEYISLDKESFESRGKVVAKLELPNEISTPGEHRILVGAKQIPKEEGGLEVVGDLAGVIKIYVPYSGKHLNGNLYIPNANLGDKVEIKLTLNNDGQEDILVKPNIILFKEGEEIKSFFMEERSIGKMNSVEFIEILDTAQIVAGDYNVSAVIDYGEATLKIEDGFRLGDLYIKLLNYTEGFERDKVNRFEIYVESLYNNPINNLYANITILDSDISFLTPSIEIGAWGEGKLEGFFDTAQIEPTKFKAKIELNYGGFVTEDFVDLKFLGEVSIEWYFIFGAALALGLGVVFWIVRRKKWQLKNKRK